MPSLRKRVSSYFRQLSFHNEPREKRNSINENSFVNKYLQGHITLKNGPPILYGKNPTDLPNYDLGPYDTGSETIIGCYSGPNGGLTTVKRTEKHLSVLDPDIDFIDTQEDVPINDTSNTKKPSKKQPKLPLDNTTMVIKAMGQEYTVTNRKKNHNKSQSLGSLTDFQIEVDETNSDKEAQENNNVNTCDSIDRLRDSTNGADFNQHGALTKNSIIAVGVDSEGNHQNGLDLDLQKEKEPNGASQNGTDMCDNAETKEQTHANKQSNGKCDNEDQNKSYGLSKSKSEGNPFQHKKKGKIIRITQRPTAGDDASITNLHPAQSLNNDSMLPTEWNRKSEYTFGISDSLYDKNQITKVKNGDPIADCFGVIARNDSAILALADGVNWGEKACIAAKSAVHGSLHYLNKTIFNDTVPFDNLVKNENNDTASCSSSSQKLESSLSENQISNTREVFVCLLRAFNCAHDLILENNGMLTTLTVAVILPLKQSNTNKKHFEKYSESTRLNNQAGDAVRFDGDDVEKMSYVCCVCNVGDTLAYVYSQKYGIRELTKGSHDINCNRDMRDALGALGPVDGINPELSNLTLSITTIQEGDIVLIASDGLSDNFDPNVCKFSVSSPNPDPPKPKRPSVSSQHRERKDSRARDLRSPQVSAQRNPHHHQPSSQQKPARPKSTEVKTENVAAQKRDSVHQDKSKPPVKPPRKTKNRDSISRSSTERSDSVEKNNDTPSGAKESPVLPPASAEGIDSKAPLQEGAPTVPANDSTKATGTTITATVILSSKVASNTATTNEEVKSKANDSSSVDNSSNAASETAKLGTTSKGAVEFDNPLIAQFLRENSLDEKNNFDKCKQALEASSNSSKDKAVDGTLKTNLKKPVVGPSQKHQNLQQTSHRDPKSPHVKSPNHQKASYAKSLSVTGNPEPPKQNYKLQHSKSMDVKKNENKITHSRSSKDVKKSESAQPPKYMFLRSKTSVEMRPKPIARNEDGIPYVTPIQRYELTLLLMEDILRKGISGREAQCVTAKKLCENLLSFTFSITSAKRHTLEDADLYFDNRNGILVEVSQHEKKIRRKRGLERVQNLPGKLDHVSVVAYNVGNFSF